jgi:hypothetical protein
MAVALLTDDPPRFRKAVKLFNETLHSYLKWGKGDWAAGGRVLGEASETLRDIYHTEFGLGGLLQVRLVVSGVTHAGATPVLHFNCGVHDMLLGGVEC